MNNKVEHIVIVGGGTAGWLSAVFLNKVLNAMPGSGCTISLVESSDIGTIGVGESTVPSIRSTFRLCGIDEDDWMRKCNASFKMAIKFVNWSGIRNNEVFWHPFAPLPSVGGLPLSHFWLKRRILGYTESYAHSCFRAVSLCEANRSPRTGNEPPYEAQVEYAYHLDAGLLADYLKQIGKARGVRHIVDNVLDVVVDQNGRISHLLTQRNGSLYGDLFIDCSGFRGILINGAMKEPFLSFSDCLFCDSAIAMPIPTDDRDNGISPYTTATALSAGWAWKTPLYGRSGNGYVYSSAFTSREAAEKEFRSYLGSIANQVEARHLKMRVGKTRNAWVRNCVSIGLASGFIEPLESTGIWFIELGLYNLMLNFPNKIFNESVIFNYNLIMNKYYEQVRDFIVLHYYTTNREDTPFWKANKYNLNISEKLQERVQLWNISLPSHEKLDDPGFFKDLSFVAILAGMERLPTQASPLLDYIGDTEANNVFLAVKNEAENLRNSLPDHYEYLTWLRR